MHTEEEAKKLWCPMARVHVTVHRDYYGQEVAAGPAVNRGNKKSYCIASECMMWRKGQILSGVYGMNETTPGGYCGLGGKP